MEECQYMLMAVYSSLSLPSLHVSTMCLVLLCVVMLCPGKTGTRGGGNGNKSRSRSRNPGRDQTLVLAHVKHTGNGVI